MKYVSLAQKIESESRLQNVFDRDIVISEFEPQSRNYVHIRSNIPRKGMNNFIIPALVLRIPLLLFFKDDSGMK